MQNKLPLVAIIGRVNVGKSTLFNKFIEERKALISKIPGTTRDLNYGMCEWQGHKFQVVDTGGLFETKIKQGRDAINRVSTIEYQIEKKAREIIDKADLILFMVDARDGILKDDRLIAQLIKKNKSPRILVANKIDKTKSITPSEFKKLGLGEPIGIAAASGVGVGDLLDEIVKFLPPLGGLQTEKNLSKGSLKVCIVGKPNVGKSSFLNQILGEEKVIVSPIPHTTREPQDTIINYKNHQIELVDTAGIRRKAKVEPNSLEVLGIIMSIKALKKSDIALFVLDISENLTTQDAQLASLIIEAGVSIIFVANKYDLLEVDKDATKKLTDYIYSFFSFLTWAPIIFTSAKSGKNCQKILSLILEIKSAREKQIDEKELNEFIKYLMKKMPPPRQSKTAYRITLGSKKKKSRAYISKIIQAHAPRPIFEIYVTNITKIPESYLRYLENNIRKRFEFEGAPIKIRVIRDKK